MEEEKHDRLAIDVASLIMNKFFNRAGELEGNLYPIKRAPVIEKRAADDQDVGHLMSTLQHQMSLCCQEQDKLFTAIQLKMKAQDNGLENDRQRNKSQRDNLKQLTRLIEELSLELSSMGAQNRTQRTDEYLSSIKSEIDALLKDRLSFQEALLSVKSEREQHLSEFDCFRTETKDLLEEKEARIMELTGKIEANEQAYASTLKMTRERRREDVETFSKQIKELLALLAELPTSHQTSSFDATEYYWEIRSTVFSLRDELIRTSGTIQEKEKIIDSNRLELIHKEKRISELEAELAAEREDKQRRITSIIDENEELMKRLDAGHKQIIFQLRESHLIELKSKDAAIAELETSCSTLESKLIEQMQKEQAEKQDEATSPGIKRPRTNSITSETSRLAPSTTSHTPNTQIRVVFTGFREQTGPKSVKYLGGLVEKLGGVVHVSDVFSENITHVVAPKKCNSIKVLAGSLTTKWIMTEEWLVESASAGSFLPESQFNGQRYLEERPFRSKIFYMTPAFQAQQVKHQFDVSCCRALIESLGKGKLVKDSTISSDYILVADDEATGDSTQRITLKTFLTMIPGYMVGAKN